MMQLTHYLPLFHPALENFSPPPPPHLKKPCQHPWTGMTSTHIGESSIVSRHEVAPDLSQASLQAIIEGMASL